MAVSIAALLTGCGQRITGDATAEGTSQTYLQALSPDQRAELGVSAQIRKLDPCGFINEAAIATLGTPAYFGSSQGFDECQVSFRREGRAVPVYKVAVDLSHHSVTGPTETIDGVAVRIERGLGCTITVPYRVRDFSYWFYASEGPDGREADVCSAAKDFVRAALPLLDTEPMRSDTTRAVDSPLARMDPCAALNVLDADPDRLQIDTGVVAYNCEVQLDIDDETTRYSIISTQKTLSMIDYAEEDGSLVTVAGVRARQRPNSCTMDIYLDESNSRTLDMGGDGPPPAHQGRADEWTDVVELTGGHGCRDLTRVAEAVVSAYQSA
ncbi:hypothetical protein [Nocardia cyriacigeorgica]|uniref:hypothetical protein n=1 Tax=Nocardia cyriacigeorgica TaxID=135487 RepID=UPI0024567066|nr:hypothetical protein [Nocardia cyriacigeorgica]